MKIKRAIIFAALVLGVAMVVPGPSGTAGTDGSHKGGQHQVVRNRRGRDKSLGGHEC